MYRYMCVHEIILCTRTLIILQVKSVEERYSRKLAFSLDSHPHHVLHLHFPLFVHNLLPVSVRLGITSVGGLDEREIKPGMESCIHYANIRKKQEYVCKVHGHTVVNCMA